MGFLNGFFQGRYGPDKLTLALFWAGIGCSILGWALAGVPYVYSVLRILALACYVYGVFRMLSRNFAARQRELAAYFRMESKIKAFWHKLRYGSRNVVNLNAERKKYKYLICPQCRQKLRVPKGKGNLRVTCAKCGCKFNAKS